ncbi:MAG: cytochrome P450 [Pyrinomonadaceae bacterium]
MDNFAFLPIQFFIERSQKYGDIFAFRIGRQKAYFIKHPDHIKEVLVTKQANFVKEDFLKRGKFILGNGLITSEPEVHRRQRRMIQPGFHQKRIEGSAATMVAFSKKTSDGFVDGSSLDMSAEMLHLTLRIVAKTLFNADIEKDAQDFGEVLTTFLDLFNMLVFPMDTSGDRPPDMTAAEIQAARQKIDNIIYRLISERRASGEDTGDLLSLLMQATDHGKGMSDELVRDEMVTLFLAGHETIANALTWSWYLLSQDAETEAKFHEELDRVLPDGREPTMKDVRSLEFTRKVLVESMRLYPPVWILGRLAIADVQIANRNIPKDSIIVMSQYITHRDPKNFADAGSFIPDRWTDEMKEKLPAFAYFPFGGGSRKCIGEQFALTEGILVLATLGRKWRFRRAIKAKPEPLFLLTLRPNGPLELVAESRV